MSTRTWLVLPFVLTLAAACGGDGAAGEQRADDSSAVATEDTATNEASPAPDSIPMEFSLTTSGGPVNNNGTLATRGMGERCTYDPSVQPGMTAAAWRVVFLTSDTSGVQMLNLEVGAPVDDTTNAFAVTLVAGTSTNAGMTMPMRYMVGTWPGGTTLGSGKVTVSRVGDGARFDVDAIDGASKTRIMLTASCARLGSVD